MRARLCVWVLVSIVVGVGVAGAENSWRLDANVRPTFEAIELKLDASQADYSGKVRIELEVSEPVDSFRFHAKGQTLTGWSFAGPAGPLELDLEQSDDGFVTARAPQTLAPGPYTLTIDFTAAFGIRGEGLYRAESGGVGYLFTHFFDVHARTAFPCWDEPAFKIPFQISLTVPEAHVAVANTPVKSETVADGLKTVVFKKSPPMSTYFLAFTSGPFESVPITGLSVPGRIYTVAGQSSLAGAAVAITPPILAALEDYFGSPHPYVKLDFVAVPEYTAGAMENPGLVTYRDSRLLLDETAPSVAQRRGMVAIIAHELAHMWYGDLVTMRWWNDLWLNESFASFVGDKISDQLFPEYAIGLGQRLDANRRMGQDALPSTVPIRHEVKSAADIKEDLGLAYQKGQQVLAMVESWIGEDAFRKGVRAYLKSHAWGNATAEDLWSALSRASKKDLSGVLSSFLDQPGVPIIDVEFASPGRVKISQRRFLNFGVEAPAQTWVIPMSLRYSVDGKVRSKTVVLDNASHEVSLGEKIEWLTPDGGALGYYRWRLPPEEMVALAGRAIDVLSTPERVAFVGNATALLDSGSLSGAAYLELLGEFGRDPEPGVVQSVISALEKVETAFVTPDLDAQFAKYIRATLLPAAERFGLEPQSGETELVTLIRPGLFGWLGYYSEQESEVRAEARRVAGAFMKDPSSVDASLAGVALMVAAKDGDRELFDAYIRHYEAATEPTRKRLFLGALGAFENPKLQRSALDYSLTDKVRPTDFFVPFDNMMWTEAGADLAFTWLQGNFAAVASRLPPSWLAYLPYVAEGCSIERLEVARGFFSQSEHQVDGTQANLRKVADLVTDCVNLRKREGASVAAFLQ
jgi:alanyl aminopeptidase